MRRTAFGILLLSCFALVLSVRQAAAETTTSLAKPTTGTRLLEASIDASSARSAELRATLDPSQAINRDLSRGSTGNDVKLLQQFLKVRGYYPDGSITGYYGEKTRSAVLSFQESEGLNPAGVVGPATRARISAISADMAHALAANNASSTLKASSTIPAITGAVLTSRLATNGAAIGPSTTFSSTTENIYAVVSLYHVPENAKIAYVRYYQGSYIDSLVTHPGRTGLAYLHFQWGLKSGFTRTPGQYRIVFYLNSLAEKSLTYTIY